MKRLVFLVLILAVSNLHMQVMIQHVGTSPVTIIVPDHYSTIQEAINAASNGDTVFVRAGTYYEDEIVVNKTLDIKGEEKFNTILSGVSSMFYIQSNDVLIQGFTIECGGVYGIYAGYTADSVTICGNFFRETRNGVYLQDCFSANVTGNIFKGKHPISSYGAITSDNADNGRIENNLIENCSGFVGGIYLSGGGGFTVVSNSVSNNLEGIRLYNSGNNTIYNNNFLNNTISACITETSHYNCWDVFPGGGNFWSDYNGSDANVDGFGDSPYVIDENNVDNYPLMEPLQIAVFISDVSYAPAVPNYTEEVVVSVRTTNLWKLDKVILYFTQDSIWESVLMNKYGDMVNATISPQPFGTIVQFKIWTNNTIGDWSESAIFSYDIGDFTDPEIEVRHLPTCPYPYVPSFWARANEPVMILANVTEHANASGVASVKLPYRVDSCELWNTAMTFDPVEELWTAIIPGQPGNSTIEYSVEAKDNAGNTASSMIVAFNVKALPLGDLNGDGYVGIDDLYMTAQHFGEENP